jgi:hypothetical protein
MAHQPTVYRFLFGVVYTANYSTLYLTEHVQSKDVP